MSSGPSCEEAGDNPERPLCVLGCFQKGSRVLEGVIGHFALYVKKAKQSVTGQGKTQCLGGSP